MSLYREIDNIGNLNREDITCLISNFTDDDLNYASIKARDISKTFFGNGIYLRGLIEFTNYCKNNCLYCGIRAGNNKVTRYRLSKEEILSCCIKGYNLGFRTFVLQGGEDPYYTDDMICDLITTIKSIYSDCALTLSLGEKSRRSYERYYEAGADRYLLRHETFDRCHYEKLHPKNMLYENRMRCLRDLQDIGFQTGCGIMVGSPFQTNENIADDIIFIRDFKPQMIGIGPFMPQKDTPFGMYSPGSVRTTLMLLCLLRIIFPNVLLPATTALNTASTDGRIRGIKCGANVIMPNLSPMEDREKYLLYDNKVGVDEDAAEQIFSINEELKKEGYEILHVRGDYVY